MRYCLCTSVSYVCICIVDSCLCVRVRYYVYLCVFLAEQQIIAVLFFLRDFNGFFISDSGGSGEAVFSFARYDPTFGVEKQTLPTAANKKKKKSIKSSKKWKQTTNMKRKGAQEHEDKEEQGMCVRLCECVRICEYV